MSRSLIKSIQDDTGVDMRLILPFGLALRLGDVVSVDKNGIFALQGNSASLLGLAPGGWRSGSGGVDFTRQHGEGTSCRFRAAGTASSLFPDVPSLSAGFDISFASQDGWILALIGRSLSSLEDIDRFRRPILQAYAQNVWQADWAFVTSVATVERMTLLASRTRNTNVALSLQGNLVSNAMELQLTAGASVVATNQQITQCITTRPMEAFCSAIRVHEGWFSDPNIGALGRPSAKSGDFWERVASAKSGDFWEKVVY